MEAEWLAKAHGLDNSGGEKAKGYARLEKEAGWLADYIGQHDCVKGQPETTIRPSRETCKNCWRQKAREAIAERADKNRRQA